MEKNDEKRKAAKTTEGKEVADGLLQSKMKKSINNNSALMKNAEEEQKKDGGAVERNKMVDTASAGGEMAAGSVGADGRESCEATRDLVVSIEVEGETKIPMLQLLKAVDNTCGRVLGCRDKGKNKWAITTSNPKGKGRLLDGFKWNIATEVTRDQRLLSFMNLPLYITDKQIYDKLSLWGLNLVSPIKKRKWAGTDVLDGTRFLKVRFNDTVSSLPYSTKFHTLEGVEYFRVLHDCQQKVCRLCLQPGHILRECPKFYCFKCKKAGHYARECTTETERCEKCKTSQCSCEEADMAEMSGQGEEEEQSAPDLGGGEVIPESSVTGDLTTALTACGDGAGEEAEVVTGSSDEFCGVPMVFRRPGRPVVRSSTPVSAGAGQSQKEPQATAGREGVQWHCDTNRADSRRGWGAV
ncbi:hypothetical protein ABVT39_001376 [Epinephelus coioides]